MTTQILGQARDPAVIQAHLKKLFAGVHSVALTDSKDAITAAMSIESESVQLTAAVPVSEQVESWLQSLLTGMQATLQVQPHNALLISNSFFSCSQPCVLQLAQKLSCCLSTIWLVDACACSTSDIAFSALA